MHQVPPESLTKAPPTQSSSPQLSKIILLTPKNAADRLAPILLQHNGGLDIRVAHTIDDLCALPTGAFEGARLVSYANEHIVPPEILNSLSFSAYNFHPGPPTYPGWAPFSFAIYDGLTSFAATAHQMVARVDAGPIVGLDLFPVPADVGVPRLIDLVIGGMSRLFVKLARPLACSAQPLPSLPILWAQQKMTKKMFAALCAIPQDIERDELLLRVKAFGLGDGRSVPTLVVNGQRFLLAQERTFGADGKAPPSMVLHGIRFVLAPDPTDR
jgi:methionyl-tRNA formyltransferase